MISQESLVKKYSLLNEGDVIAINENVDYPYIVYTNRRDDHLFLVAKNDESKSFHLFYDEIDPSQDDFQITGK